MGDKCFRCCHVDQLDRRRFVQESLQRFFFFPAFVLKIFSLPKKKGQLKCAQYWPNELSESVTVGSFSVQLTDHVISKEVTTRRLDVTNLATKELRVVVHLHYTFWPDHGVPESAQSFLELARLAEDNNNTRG